MRKYARFTIGLMVLIMFSGTSGYAESDAILPISPVPDVSSVPEKKESQFDNIFVISRIGKHEIVFEDDLYRISPDATFYSKKGKRISQNSFRQGDTVGIVLDIRDRQKVMSLWKIKSGKPSKRSRRNAE